jgi:cyclase
MLLKRLLGTVVVRQGLAVQSFGYNHWLPLGKPECLVQNLDRWGADGIVVLSVDRGDQGPDLQLIERLGALGLSTPLTYGGGVRTEQHARSAVLAGAERIVLDAVLNINPTAVYKMASTVGVQALVASLPLICNEQGDIKHWCYYTKCIQEIGDPIKNLIKDRMLSELLAINVSGEGQSNGFDVKLLTKLEILGDLPILAFGGLSSAKQIRPLLKHKRVAGVLVGNSLNYREHSIRSLKLALSDLPLRPFVFPKSL